MQFLVVDLANDVSVDYYEEKDDAIALQHLAFLVGEDEFDAALARIRQRTKEIWADPAKAQPGRINRHFGGRGVYFEDPDGHLFEIITKPYGDPADCSPSHRRRAATHGSAARRPPATRGPHARTVATVWPSAIRERSLPRQQRV